MSEITSLAQYRARMAELDRLDRRCSGGHGTCSAEAITEAEIYRVKPDGTPDGPRRIVKVCGKPTHSRPYLDSSTYRVVRRRDLTSAPQTPSQPIAQQPPNHPSTVSNPVFLAPPSP